MDNGRESPVCFFLLSGHGKRDGARAINGYRPMMVDVSIGLLLGFRASLVLVR